jgi:hypothetical protein
MDGSVRWIASGVVGVAGVFGLFLAANAADRGIYAFGLGLAGFAIIYIFGQMKQGFDASDRARHAPAPEPAFGERAIIGKVTP